MLVFRLNDRGDHFRGGGVSRTVGIRVRFAYVNLFSSLGERQMASAAFP
jgi:hypothetical protein